TASLPARGGPAGALSSPRSLVVPTASQPSAYTLAFDPDGKNQVKSLIGAGKVPERRYGGSGTPGLRQRDRSLPGPGWGASHADRPAGRSARTAGGRSRRGDGAPERRGRPRPYRRGGPGDPR